MKDSTPDYLFGKRASDYTASGGYEQKSRLLECVGMGDLAAIGEVLDTYITHLKTMVADDMSFTRNALLYVWPQLNFAAIEAGMSENASRDIQEKYYFDLERASSADEMLSMCASQVMEFTEGVHRIKKANSYSPPIRKCCDYIRSRIYEKPTVESIAEAMHFSRSYISHKFRDETGMSIHSYIQQEKVEEAKLLLKTHVPLSDIAANLGFSSQSHFTEAFKRSTGLTPNQYRKQT